MCIGGRLHGRCCVEREKPLVSVPLVGVKVTTVIVDYTAEVTLQQRYENLELNPIEAVYSFTLQEKAAVCGFEALFDGNVINGIIREKEEAQEIYDDALASGNGAYLLEESTSKPNVFTASIGNLAPKKDVIITLKYILELPVSADKSVQFSLPTTSNFPSAQSGEIFHVPKFNPKDTDLVNYGLSVEIFLEMSSPVKNARSDSHKIMLAEVDVNRSKVLLINPPESPLVSDFTLNVSLTDPHLASVKVQSLGKDQKVAMLSLFPNQDLAEDSTVYTEMVFLIDRSGSMMGSKIDHVRDTMQLLLRSIPEGTLFNIIGFGTHHEVLFKSVTVEYNDSTLKIANDHVKNLKANLGGTNILTPLKHILENNPPKPGIPRQLFILTDGKVKNREACIDYIKSHAQTTRVFTFGIGNDVDVDLVKGMAKAGGGNAELIRDHEVKEIDIKVLNQIKRALQPALTDLKVKWDDKLRVTRYAPFTPPLLWAGSRFVLYAFLSEDSEPGEVIITANSARGEFQCKSFVDPNNVILGQGVVKLGFKALITDLQERKSALHKSAPELNVENEIIELSIQNNILSQFTSFIAVEKRNQPVEGTLQIREVPLDYLQKPPKMFDFRSGGASSIKARKGGYELEVKGLSLSTNEGSRSRSEEKSKDKSSKKEKEMVMKEVNSSNRYAERQMRSVTKAASISPRSSSFAKPLVMEEEDSSSQYEEEIRTKSFPISPRSSPSLPFTITERISKSSPKKPLPSLSLSSSQKPASSSSSPIASAIASVSVGIPQNLRDLMLQQKASGAFPDDVLASLGSHSAIKQDVLYSLLPPSTSHTPLVLSIIVTAITVLYLELKHASHFSYFELITKKARAWILKSKKGVISDDVDLFVLAKDFIEKNL